MHSLAHTPLIVPEDRYSSRAFNWRDRNRFLHSYTERDRVLHPNARAGRDRCEGCTRSCDPIGPRKRSTTTCVCVCVCGVETQMDPVGLLLPCILGIRLYVSAYRARFVADHHIEKCLLHANMHTYTYAYRSVLIIINKWLGERLRLAIYINTHTHRQCTLRVY